MNEMTDLDARKQAILKAVVVEYVSQAEPVGSSMLTAKYEFGVRSATIRNELAEMVDLGFLEQPHTSAGRIPSHQGYRFFVDRLVIPQPPLPETRQRLRSAIANNDPLHGMLRETTKTLSRLTKLLGAAAIFGQSTVQVRHAVVSALSADRALLVVVLSSGLVENRVVECPSGLTLHDLGKANELLAGQVVGQTLRSLVRAKALSLQGGNPPVERLLQAVSASIKAMARELTRGKLIIEGSEFLFAQPELQRDSRTLYDLVSALGDEPTMYLTVAGSDESPSQITIGREHANEKLRAFSIVRQRFFAGDEEAGTIALFGPTRMDYDGTLSLLDFTAKAISMALSRII